MHSNPFIVSLIDISFRKGTYIAVAIKQRRKKNHQILLNALQVYILFIKTTLDIFRFLVT